MTDILDRPADTGTWRQVEGGYELAFERRLRHSPERVWAALTTPEGLARWLAEAEIEQAAGGRMDLNFTQPATADFPDTCEVRQQANTVLAYEPITRFQHSFGHPDSIVTWTLTPDGAGAHLSLHHRVPLAWETNLARTLSGWHHHMEGLDDAVAGRRHPWSWARWAALRDAYAERMAAIMEAPA